MLDSLRHLARFAWAVLVLLAVAPATATAEPFADSYPTEWHRAAGLEPLLTAPEPPNPVAVCVIDSGVNLTPDLEPAVISRTAYDGGDPGDTYPQPNGTVGHGTYVATFLAGQVNGWGSAGAWPRVKIVSVRVFAPGATQATAADYARALRVCRQAPAVRVVNISLGKVSGTPAEISELENRVRDLRQTHDVNVIASAGNGGGDVEAPASFAEVVAVAAGTPEGSYCSTSARGPAVDIVAPGCGLTGATETGDLAEFDGSSYAAPLVSATLAAIRAYTGASASDAERLLLATARPTPAGRFLDARSALLEIGVSWASVPGPADDQTTTDSPAPAALRPDFVDYPRPKLRVCRDRRGRVMRVRLRNRPAGATVAVRIGSRTLERSRDSFSARVPKRRKWVRARFLSDTGASPITKIRVRRRCL